MNNNTKSILDLYNDDIIELDISNKNIKGYLNLSKFKKLKKLNCSNNNITKIIGIKNLTNIDCSNNKIIKLSDGLFFSSQNNITTNPIEEIEYPFDKNKGFFGNTVKKIIFTDDFNDNIDNLPLGLEILILGKKFNKSVDNLPNTLKEIHFGNSFNQPLDYLPNSLNKIVFEQNFNQSLDNLPNSINEIKFNVSNFNENKFNYDINFLPNQLSKLILPSNFDKEIFNFPPNLKYLYLGKKFNKTLNNLPESLEILIFDSQYNQQIYKLPNNLRHLSFSKKMNYSNLLKILPNSMISLCLPDDNRIYSINNNIISNLKKIKIENFNYNNFVFDIIKNSNLEELFLQVYLIKIDVILSNLPKTIKKLTVVNIKTIKEHIRITTNLLPNSLNFFQINGNKYDENKLKYISNEQFYNL